MTTEKWRFDVSDLDDSRESQLLHERLREHVELEVGPSNRKVFSVLARNDEGVVGGVRGYSHWGWLYVSHFWVARDYRSKGLGAELLRKTEDLARSRSLEGLYIDTFSDRAKSFYEKAGFHLLGSIPNFPVGHSRHFLTKKLG